MTQDKEREAFCKVAWSHISMGNFSDESMGLCWQGYVYGTFMAQQTAPQQGDAVGLLNAIYSDYESEFSDANALINSKAKVANHALSDALAIGVHAAKRMVQIKTALAAMPQQPTLSEDDKKNDDGELKTACANFYDCWHGITAKDDEREDFVRILFDFVRVWQRGK